MSLISCGPFQYCSWSFLLISFPFLVGCRKAIYYAELPALSMGALLALGKGYGAPLLPSWSSTLRHCIPQIWYCNAPPIRRWQRWWCCSLQGRLRGTRGCAVTLSSFLRAPSLLPGALSSRAPPSTSSCSCSFFL